MLLVPTTLQAVRGGYLALILMGSVLVLKYQPERWRVSRYLVYWLVVCVTYSLFSSLWGVLNNAHGAISVLSVYAIWPIIFIYVIGFSGRIDCYVVLLKVLLVGIFFAALSGVLLIASHFYPAFGILQTYFDLMGGGIGVYDGTIEYNLYNMPTVIYGLPFLISLLLLRKQISFFLSDSWLAFSWLCLLLSFFAMLISGRRAFVVVGLIALPLSMLLMSWSGRGGGGSSAILKTAVGALIAITLVVLISSMSLGTDISSLSDDFLMGFDFGDQSNISASRRAEEFSALIGEWQSSPILGLGHGSSARNSPGDVDSYAYELQYVALLFQTGIIGMLIYGSAVLWLLRKMIFLARRHADLAVLILPTMVGLICFLIANATNPYLSKFDYLWVLFLPIGLVNIGLLRAGMKKTPSEGPPVHA